MTLPTASSVLAVLSAHPSREAWATLVRESALDAYAKRERSVRASDSARLEGDSATPYGDLKELLSREPQNDTERWTLGALCALALVGDERRADTADALVWLAANTPVDALSMLEEALGEDAEALWPRLAHIARSPQEFALGRGEALTAAAALMTTKSSSAAREVRELASRTQDPLLAAVLTPSSDSGDRGSSLSGELTAAPRHAAWTAILGLTGILAVVWLVKLLGRYALAFKRPAAVRLTSRGLELDHRTEMLGRVLRDRETLVPIDNVAKVTREVRYARAGLYAGLFALAIGLYAGISLFVDGVRVPGSSPSLLGMAFVLVVVGLGVDFGLSSLSDSARGKCRLVVEPRKGKRLCIATLDPSTADAMLARLAEQTKV